LRQVIEQQASIGELTSELPSETATSRWVWGHKIYLKLYTGDLFSAAQLQVLDGQNAIAVRANNGAWEIIQFTTADLIGDGEWELSGLLRGQLGTETEALAGASPEADVVVLNEAVEPILDSEIQKGQVINWLYGRSDKPIGDASLVQQEGALGFRGDFPFSPVHLRASQASDNSIFIRWIRRNRLRSDSWNQIEIPQSEAQETYSIRFKNELGHENELTSVEPNLVVFADQLTNWFGQYPSSLTVEVAQVSATVGAGTTSNVMIDLN